MPFIICPFNRYSFEAHLFRSPWSSKYFPEKNRDPSFKQMYGEAHQELKSLEQYGNEMFNFYGELYYGIEGLATSFYIIDYEKGEFIECIFLLQKKEGGSKWSTCHHFKILLQTDRTSFSCHSSVHSTLSNYKNTSQFESSVKDH